MGIPKSPAPARMRLSRNTRNGSQVPCLTELTRRSRIEVPRVDYEKLSGDRAGETSESIRARVQAALDIQTKRYSSTGVSNIVCNAGRGCRSIHYRLLVKMVVGRYADRLAGRLGPVVVRPGAVRVVEGRPVARRSDIGGDHRFRPVVVRPGAVRVVESRPVATHYEPSKTTVVRLPLDVTVAVIRSLLSPRSRKVIVAVPPPEALPKSAAAMSRSNCRSV